MIFRSPLQARSLAERSAALDAKVRDLDAELQADVAALQAKITAARAAREVRVEEVHATVARRADELDTELATSIRAKLFPIAAQFASNRDRVANEIVDVVNAHAIDVRETLGEEPSLDVVVAAFLAAFGGDAAVGLLPYVTIGQTMAQQYEIALREGPVGLMSSHNRVDNWRDAFTAFGIERVRLLGLVEVAVARTLGDSNIKPDAERAEVMLAHAGQRHASAALAAFEARRKVEREQAAARLCEEQLEASRAERDATAKRWGWGRVRSAIG